MLKELFRKLDRRLRRTKYQNIELSRQLAELRTQMTFLEGRISAESQTFKADFEKLHNMVEGYPQVVENLRNHNAMLDGYSQIVENLRNNNVIQTRFRDELDAMAIKVNKALKAGAKWEQSGMHQKMDRKGSDAACVQSPAVTSDSGIKAENAYAQVDYFDFENHFRGNREDIKQSQSQYLDYFKGCSNVLDIGCGRGEFLELLQENHIGGIGVDLYDEYAEYCQMKGLNAVCDDCLHYLEQCSGVDGIFVGQVVEHLEADQIMELCVRAYEKLEENHYIILETPNPTSLAIYTHAFYIDPSHVKPVHPLTLQYYMEKAGFKNIQIVYTKSSRLDTVIPEIRLSDEEQTEAFNKAMQVVSETLFGSQDYAVIAKR